MNITEQYQQPLIDGLKTLKLNNNPETYLRFIALLNKWNSTYNLTAIRSIPEMIHKHLLDSLAIYPYLQGEYILDIGSGAGLPGIPLAIAHPQKKFVLLDSNGKKTRFMQAARRELHLDNIEVVQSRVESYHPGRSFATVLSRAFSDVQQMVRMSAHLVDEKGIWLAMKGRAPDAELKGLQYPWQLHQYQVPGLLDERCVVVINHFSGTQHG